MTCSGRLDIRVLLRVNLKYLGIHNNTHPAKSSKSLIMEAVSPIQNIENK